jgi:hypothetical protein
VPGERCTHRLAARRLARIVDPESHGVHPARINPDVGETLDEARRRDENAKFVSGRDQLEATFMEGDARFG